MHLLFLPPFQSGTELEFNRVETSKGSIDLYGGDNDARNVWIYYSGNNGCCTL